MGTWGLIGKMRYYVKSGWNRAQQSTHDAYKHHQQTSKMEEGKW